MIELPDRSHKSNLLDNSNLESIHSSSAELSPLAPYHDFEYAPFELPITKRINPDFFKLRAKILSPFTKRVPFTQYELGPFLVFVLCSLAFAFMEYHLYTHVSFKNKGPRKTTGALAALSLCIALTLSCRNSIWSVILGIPFERGLFWHKFFAYWGVVLSIGHGLVDAFEDSLEVYSGLALSATIFLMAITSFFPIRRYSFRFFQVVHWFLFLSCVICAILHGAGEVLLGSILFVIDLSLRFVIIRRNKRHLRKICIEKLPFNVLRVSFARHSLKYKAGQYFSICIPSVSCYEFHPFSISSSPSDDQILLHIRIVGPWTKNVSRTLKNTVNPDIDAFIDGPYGNPNVFLDSSEIKVFLMVSGGIGVTPLQSIARELMSQKSRGRDVKKIMFIWSVRDRNMLNSEEIADFYRRDLPVVFQPDFFEVKEDETLQCRFHLTSARSESEFYKGNIHPSKQKSLRMGRPNIEAYVREICEFGKRNGEGKVGVMCCGPEDLMKNVREECRKRMGGGVEMVMHEEVFEF